MLDDFISGRKSLFSTGVHTELRAQENRQRRVTLVQGNLTANQRTEISGVSARVYQNGVYGFSSMAECSAQAAETVLKAATDNAAFMDRHIRKGKAPLPALLGGTTPVNHVIRETGQKQYIEFVQEVDAYIAKKYPSLSSRTVVAAEDSMEKLLCTSDGHDGHISSPRSYIYVFLDSQTNSGKKIVAHSQRGSKRYIKLLVCKISDKNFFDNQNFFC